MQSMVMDERLDHRTRADHHTRQPGEQVALAATSELVARASTGDQVAWDQLVDRYGGMVWAVARAHELSPRDAADVSQVTWLLLTQLLGSLQRPEELEGWLLRTAAREADRMRRLRGYADGAGGDPDDHVAGVLDGCVGHLVDVDSPAVLESHRPHHSLLLTRRPEVPA
jgi:DNA-directed RNA polymerase specialized sigma24 family protein